MSSSSVATATTTTTATTDGGDPLGLTRELRKLTDAFEAIGDDKLRYKQLLYMANQLPPMDETYKVPENKVPGCLSTVHIHATLDQSSSSSSSSPSPVVQFVGDSDGLLTKGLVALLVRGLSGNTPQAIQSVNPAFIQTAGIAASLTPGRNNGFMNMLAVMKKKALELEQQQQQEEEEKCKASTTTTRTLATSSSSGSSSRPKYDAIITALQKLQPVKLELIDNSHQHAGHAGASGDEESHFDLTIVADAFDGLNLVKRHQLVYMMLGDVMPQIHALQIRAQTPTEAGL
jgi:sulfur transfer protein SufE/stress-induced morphogen